jgi:adsorption protein B
VPVIDTLVAACLLPLALWILLSGLDDLFVDLAWVRTRRHRPPPENQPGTAAPEQLVAIFIPLWREHRVVGGMLEHNLAAIRYRRFEVFVGCYPNDERTRAAVCEAQDRFDKVHLALCPHDGPTSKADNLNSIYHAMLEFERERSVRFEVVVLHDAEDLVHPDELAVINAHAGEYPMVQIPVLPLPTPLAARGRSRAG